MERRKRGLHTGVWAAILAAVFIAAAGCALVMHTGGEGMVARIYQDGVLIREVDLSAADEAYEFTITSDSGFNTVSVRDGSIRVSCADCSDQTCVKQGWLSGGLTPIVCLPHGLVIRLEKQPQDVQFDAVAG